MIHSNVDLAMQAAYRENMQASDSQGIHPLDNLLGYHLRRASAVMMADLGERLFAVGLRPTEATILLLIESYPGCIQSDVGRILGIQRANMVPMIAALERAGLIVRSAMDGRSFALHLTEAGKTTLKAAKVCIDTHESHFQSLFTANESGGLIASMRRISGAEE
jgi:DNA-binding MarR family transcriptional regulator